MYVLKASDPQFQGVDMWYVGGGGFNPIREQALKYQSREKAMEVQNHIKREYDLETQIEEA